MKKILGLCFLCLFFTGCVHKNAKDAVISYLEKYRNHEEEVVSVLDSIIEEQQYTPSQEDLFKLVMKRQFVNLEYQIQEMTYYGEKAVVKVDIEVYHYAHSQKKALEDFKHQQGNEKTLQDLELNYMKEEKQRIKYTIFLDTIFQDHSWIVKQPAQEVIEKIEGIWQETEEKRP